MLYILMIDIYSLCIVLKIRKFVADLPEKRQFVYLLYHFYSNF